MANVDLELNLEDDVIEDLIAVYIRTNMSTASYEVFMRDREKTGVRVAAGCALLNEAIINAIIVGMEIDTIDFDFEAPVMSEEFNEELIDAVVATGHTRPTENRRNDGRVSVIINGEQYYYPVGHDISYDEIAFHGQATQPSVTVNSPRFGESIMRTGQVVTVEEGMVINAFDTNNA